MTQRELDARVASIQYTETTDLNLPAIEVAGDAFEAGVEWADGHPHWTSVEDELPPYGQQVLVYSERDPWAEMWWSNRYTEDGARFGEDGKYKVMTDNNGFATLRDDDNEPIQVTHWMRIEPPAVLSGLERTEKKWGRIEYGQ